MSVPPLSDFSRESGWNRWVAAAAQGDFDFAVPDDGGVPQESALALLRQAAPAIDQLLNKAQEYILSFCSATAFGLTGTPSLIEVSVAPRRGKPNVFVALNFEGDLYGLWSVGFVQSEPPGWIAVSFTREAW